MMKGWGDWVKEFFVNRRGASTAEDAEGRRKKEEELEHGWDG